MPTSPGPEVRIPLALLTSGATLHSIRLWLLIRDVAGGDYTPTDGLTIASMARMLRCSEGGVNRCLRQLRDSDWLHIQYRANRASLYSTTWPVTW